MNRREFLTAIAAVAIAPVAPTPLAFHPQAFALAMASLDVRDIKLTEPDDSRLPGLKSVGPFTINVYWA
jgi:hypothetical protein